MALFAKPPEIDHHLLCFVHVDAEVMGSAPHRKLNLPSVCRLAIVADQSQHCRVTRKLADGVAPKSGSTVTWEQTEQKGAQNAALWGACGHCDGARCAAAHPNCLLLLLKKTQSPLTNASVTFCRLLFHLPVWNDGIEG